MKNKVRWYDWLVYKLFYKRWNKIYLNKPVLGYFTALYMTKWYEIRYSENWRKKVEKLVDEAVASGRHKIKTAPYPDNLHQTTSITKGSF